MPRASEATPWVTDCHSIDALKGQKHSMLEIDIKLLPLQGVTNERALTQGVASLALGYVLLGFQPALTKSETPVFVHHQKF